MKRFILLAALLHGLLYAQQPVSVHQEQWQYYHDLGITADQYQQLNQPRPVALERNANCTLQKTVFGWHPYWSNGLEANYQWNLISDLCYFSYEVDPNTGNASSTHSFMTADVVDTALARGVKVHLCVTLFGSHATFFANATARNTLINNLVTLVQNRGAHGVNIDFEGVPSSQSANLTAFMIDLCNAMHAANPNYKVSICTYAVDWSNVFDEVTLAQYVDFITIMGYDYYWTGSSQAGPVDPLYGFSSGYDYSLSRTVSYYVKQGMPASKIVLGLPYYGREWETTTNAIPGSTTGNNVSSRTYAYVKDNTSGFYTGGQFNQRSCSRAYIFQNAGTWRQCWISEGYEMKRRYDLVNQRGLKGIGIWALGYDDGYTELWDAIESKLTDCAVVPCSDTLYDGGGPLVNYYDNENYAFTVAPDGAAQVTLDFQSFATEVNYDTLWLYDGPSVTSPLIGYYHGTTSPGFITSTGNALTLRFKSDGSTRAAGWMAVWGCIQDNTPPTVSMASPPDWVTQDFTASFTDNDNISLQYPVMNVADYNGTEWRSNAQYGFFTDDFNTAIHPDWSATVGTWSIVSGQLVQSDQAQNNTNLYAYVNQDTADVYVYEWKGTTTGSGSNRRSGFHFFCDDAVMDNRGNSYFIWFRLNDQKLQFYETINDVFFLRYEVPFTTVAGQTYQYRVVYSKVTGTIDVYVDGVYVASWTDSTPYQTGQHISFRSGSCQYAVDDLRVYRLRSANEPVSVGSSSAMLRYQNPDPLTPAGRIRSLVTDATHHFSALSDSLLNIDWTPPQAGAWLHDGYNGDLDTVYAPATFGGRWSPFSDPHSAVTEVYYSLGTAPYLDDQIAWTSSAMLDSCTYSAAGLAPGTWYYLNLYAVDGAALISDTISSDGFRYLLPDAGLPGEQLNALIYPNPVQDILMISGIQSGAMLAVYDMQGNLLYTATASSSGYLLPMSGWAPGMYLLNINGAWTKVVKS